MQVEIRNLQETIDKLDLLGNQVHQMDRPLRYAASLVTETAKHYAPVDTGKLRSSIVAGVKSNEFGISGIAVSSNIAYAPHMEYGTRPHFPPVSALQGWARRHGMNPFLVARAISRRGTKAHRFMRRALDENRTRIIQIFEEYVKKLVG
jgi:HK97 gp10 family phage protein